MMCDVKHCKGESVMVYYNNYKVCERCWDRHCNDIINLKKEFNIKEGEG